MERILSLSNKEDHRTMSHSCSILSTLSLKEYPVKSIEGRELGKIQELMIDLEKGCIVYVVLELQEEVVGTNVRRLALPWSTFTFDPKTKDLVLDIDTEQLEDEPPVLADSMQTASYQSNRESKSTDISRQVSWQHVVGHSIMNYSANAI